MESLLSFFANIDWLEIWLATGDTLMMLGGSLLVVLIALHFALVGLVVGVVEAGGLGTREEPDVQVGEVALVALALGLRRLRRPFPKAFAALHAELAVEPVHVRLHRCLGDVERRCDLAVRETGLEAHQHLAFGKGPHVIELTPDKQVGQALKQMQKLSF